MSGAEILVTVLSSVSAVSLAINGFFLMQMFARLDRVETVTHAHETRLSVMESRR